MKTMSLPQKIVQIRKTRGYSQEELTNKANISLRTLQRIEKGKSEPLFSGGESSNYFFSVSIWVPALGYVLNALLILLSVFRVRKEKRWVYILPLKFV